MTKLKQNEKGNGKMRISENLRKVRENIEQACIRAGRDPGEVLLLGVTKTHSADIINCGIEAGLTDIGENRVQEILEKYDHIDKRAKVHLIGHLQTNKVKHIIDKVDMVHSVDSLKLAKEISERAEKIGKVMDVLVQVNISGEVSKSGIEPEKLDMLFEEISVMPGIRVRGLMTIPPIEAGEMENTRRIFRELRKIYVDKSSKMYDNIKMEFLSMGMSNDYEIAIEEGSNIVRVGRAIFGER